MKKKKMNWSYLTIYRIKLTPLLKTNGSTRSYHIQYFSTSLVFVYLFLLSILKTFKDYLS